MKVSFEFSQILQTAHPDVHVPIKFEGEAAISDDGIEILSVCECSLRHDLKIPKGLEAQNLTSGEMGKFLARCRMAAIDAENDQCMSFGSVKYMNDEY